MGRARLVRILWVYSAIHALGVGDPGPAIRAACALLLMILLMGMEGLEVAVIDRWRIVYPERSPHELPARSTGALLAYRVVVS